MELAIVELAVKRLTDERAEALRAAVESERRAPDQEVPIVGHDLHAQLAGMVDNPVFELLSLVLIRLTRMHQGRPPGMGRPHRGDVHDAHAAIVAAITERDAGLASHRMRRHLRAWVQ